MRITQPVHYFCGGSIPSRGVSVLCVLLIISAGTRRLCAVLLGTTRGAERGCAHTIPQTKISPKSPPKSPPKSTPNRSKIASGALGPILGDSGAFGDAPGTLRDPPGALPGRSWGAPGGSPGASGRSRNAPGRSEDSSDSVRSSFLRPSRAHPFP